MHDDLVEELIEQNNQKDNLIEQLMRQKDELQEKVRIFSQQETDDAKRFSAAQDRLQDKNDAWMFCPAALISLLLHAVFFFIRIGTFKWWVLAVLLPTSFIGSYVIWWVLVSIRHDFDNYLYGLIYVEKKRLLYLLGVFLLCAFIAAVLVSGIFGVSQI